MPIPLKLAERIWRREFIDMHELSPTRLGAPEPTLHDLLSQEKAKKQKHINRINEWVIRFNTYISVIALREPQRVPDLLAYSSLVVQASRDYAGTPWRAYDIHFRKQAAATKLTKWGEKDPSLWLSYFAPALAKQRCEECGSFDHDKKDCEVVQGSQGAKTQLTRKGTHISQSTARFAPYPSKTPPICKKWNRGNCSFPSCSYRHICMECHSTSHQEPDCPFHSPTGPGG